MNPSEVRRYKIPKKEPIMAYMSAEAIKDFVYLSIFIFLAFFLSDSNTD